MAAGSFQRILKNLGATVAGRLISVLQQVLVPALFVYRYGLAGFGEWGALSGAVSAASMLNFGVQTYMNQDLAIRFQRGETEDFHRRQSTALRLLGGVVLGAAVVSLAVFALPLDRLLKLDLPRGAVQLTVYLLALQVLLGILFGYFCGIFMSVGLAHRGAHWNNAQSLAGALGLLGGLTLHASFPTLAALQLGSLVLCLAGVLADLRLHQPQVFPTLRYWERSALAEILRGSGSFGILEMSTFLVFSAPLLVMQRVLGPVAVAAFILMRTIFSMCRQVLAIFTQSMAAEITNLFGRRDWPLLTRLYTYSERFIFFLITVVNLTVLMLSPALIRLWMHRRGAAGGGQLFAVYPYVLCSAISMVISLKEHKHQFQFSTNTHRELARVVLVGYTAMVMLSFVSVPVAGVIGFLWTWLTVESLLTLRLVAMNRRLFAHMEALDTAYILRLVVLGVAGLAGAALALPHTAALPLAGQAGIAALAALLVGAVSWQVFQVRPVYALMVERLRGRSAEARIG